MESRWLETWEAGVDQRSAGRALALLAGAAVEPEGKDWARATVGRRDASLLDLRERLFGSRYTGITPCPSCGLEIELSFEAAEVRREVGHGDAVELQVEGVDVVFRLPNGGDLAAIESAGDVAAARATLLARCIRAGRDGAAIELAQLPARVVEAIVDRMGALDPQADVSIEVECPSCLHQWLEPFDIVSFLWAEVAERAGRLLDEVHLLASAYGWSERDILALAPARRGAYVEMVR
jgi:hypothetical protein